MDNTRIGAIDIAKGIGIILVIVGHALPSDNPIRVFVYTFHMPLFFILVGMVMKVPEHSGSVFQEFLTERKILASYCLYSLIFFIFDVIVRFGIQRQIGLGGLFWDFYQTVVFYGINVLWFLATLVFAKILAKRICRISVSKVYWLLIGIALFAACSMISEHIQWLDMGKYRLIYYPLVAILRVASTAVYILLGYILGEKAKGYIKRSKIWVTTCVAALAALFLFFIFNFAGNVDIHIMRMGNWFIAFICAIFGFMAVFGVSILLDKVVGIRELLYYIGINSLFIMATHDYLKIREIINWVLQNLNLLERQYTVLLQIVLLIGTECILCKLCAPYVERVINRMSKRDRSII